MKVCCKCRISKDENEFFKDSSRKDRLNSKCKECDKIQHQKYIEQHPEYKKKQIKRISEWTKNNKEIQYEASKKWKLENKDRINELKRLWRKNNPEKVIAQRLRDSLKNKDSVVL
jgi:hypothetical protein